MTITPSGVARSYLCATTPAFCAPEMDSDVALAVIGGSFRLGPEDRLAIGVEVGRVALKASGDRRMIWNELLAKAKHIGLAGMALRQCAFLG